VLAKRWGAWNQWAVLCGCMLICTLMSDEIGYALYWADGYANVVLPFFLMVLGLALMTRGDAWAAPGVLLLMAAALAHEVLCIFSIGYAALTLAFRKFPVHPLRWRALYVGVALLSLALLWAQSFSAGPNARSAAYLQKSGMSYNLAGVWNGLRCIDPLRTALAFLGTLGLIAAAGERLSVPLQRASKHARSNRLYWSLLCAGALLTSLLPLGTVGLKKPKVNVAAYSVATELFVIFGAALFYPLVAAPLAKLFAPYRRWVYSVVPLLFVLAAVSRNVDGYITAVTQFDALRDQARVYTETLFSAQKRARVTRPCHAFIKPNSGMTARTAAEYFRLEKLRELACPK
jgi:hypothetical protein